MTRHLNRTDLLDVADGSGRASDASHIETCGRCRATVDDLRLALARAREVSVPEPSPLFWEHLSTRIKHAVSREPQPRRFAWGLSWLPPNSWRPAAVAMSLALALAGALFLRGGWRNDAVRSEPAATAPATASRAAEMAETVWPLSPAGDEVPLGLVGALLDGMEAETGQDAGLILRPGSAEHAAGQLSAAERRELARLIRAQLRPAS